MNGLLVLMPRRSGVDWGTIDLFGVDSHHGLPIRRNAELGDSLIGCCPVIHAA
jgi:hypothetical protein